MPTQYQLYSSSATPRRTFRELCGSTGYEALLAYERLLNGAQLGFLAHMSLEPDRLMSPAQADWAKELLKRAEMQQRIERGERVLPPKLDPPAAPQACTPPPRPANDNLDHLQEMLGERGFKVG